MKERWPVQLVLRLREEGFTIAEPEIIARTGWTTGELSLAIDQAAPQGPYELVTLMVGVNNQFRGREIEEYWEEFGALLQRAVGFAGGNPSRVIVLSIPDWGATPFGEGRDLVQISTEIDLFNSANRSLAKEAGAGYVDVTPISREAEEDANLIANDQLHPSGKMYAAWTDLMLPGARAILATP